VLDDFDWHPKFNKYEHLFENAISVWDEYLGNHNPKNDQNESEIFRDRYYIVDYGDVSFFVLDGRAHRTPASGEDGPAKTMLGVHQKKRLFEWLTTKTSSFKVEKKKKTFEFLLLLTLPSRSSLFFALEGENSSW
jgi:phosphodiesterase/alkaline phosphatase D-like protein